MLKLIVSQLFVISFYEMSKIKPNTVAIECFFSINKVD